MDESSEQSGQDPKENAPPVQTVCIISSWESQYHWQATMIQTTVDLMK